MALLLGAAAPGPPLVVYVPAAEPAAAVRVLQTRVLAPYGRAVRLSRVVGRSFDVALLDDVALAAGCAGGTLRHLDWDRLGGRSRFLPFATGECGAGAAVRVIALGWDGSRLGSPPEWADLWNVARMPGQRGLFRGAEGTLEIALMADGVAPRDVYGVLGGSGGVDRALRRLDQLRPYIVWWRTGAEAAAALLSGKVLMSSVPASAVQGDARLVLSRRGAIERAEGWAIAAESRNPDAAAALIAAATASPAAPPTESDALRFDAGFWRDRGVDIDRRFSEWLNKRGSGASGPGGSRAAPRPSVKRPS